MKLRNLAMIESLEKQNEELERGNLELKRRLYFRKFINNPLRPDERED